MSLPEYEILVQLSEAPGRRLRMSELADRVVSSRSRITHTVGRMEERGLVHREAVRRRRPRRLVRAHGRWLRTCSRRPRPGHVETCGRIMFDPLAPEDVDALGVALDEDARGAARAADDGAAADRHGSALGVRHGYRRASPAVVLDWRDPRLRQLLRRLLDWKVEATAGLGRAQGDDGDLRSASRGRGHRLPRGLAQAAAAADGTSM